MKATGIVLCDWTLCIAVYWSFVPVSPANTHKCSLSFTQWHLHILITDEKLVLINILMSPWEVLLTSCHLLYAQARKIVHHVHMIDKLCPSKRQNKQCAIGYGWDFVWRLWILLLGQSASRLHGEITGNASLIKLHHWNTDAHAINGSIIACHACCGKRNFLTIFADIWLARSSKLFYMEQMNYSTTCFCLCWKTASVLSMASLSFSRSLL